MFYEEKKLISFIHIVLSPTKKRNASINLYELIPSTDGIIFTPPLKMHIIMQNDGKCIIHCFHSFFLSLLSPIPSLSLPLFLSLFIYFFIYLFLYLFINLLIYLSISSANCTSTLLLHRPLLLLLLLLLLPS